MKRNVLSKSFSVIFSILFFLLVVCCVDVSDIDNLQSEINDLKSDISKLTSDTGYFFNKTYELEDSKWEKTFAKDGASTSSNFKYEIAIIEFTESKLKNIDVRVHGYIYPNKSDLYSFAFPYIDVVESIEVRYSFYLRPGKVVLEQALYDRENKPKPQSSADNTLKSVRIFSNK